MNNPTGNGKFFFGWLTGVKQPGRAIRQYPDLKNKKALKYLHNKFISAFFRWWPHQESNLDLELRKLLYYPLYYEAGTNWFAKLQVSGGLAKLLGEKVCPVSIKRDQLAG